MLAKRSLLCNDNDQHMAVTQLFENSGKPPSLNFGIGKNRLPVTCAFYVVTASQLQCVCLLLDQLGMLCPSLEAAQCEIVMTLF